MTLEKYTIFLMTKSKIFLIYIIQLLLNNFNSRQFLLVLSGQAKDDFVLHIIKPLYSMTKAQNQ